MRRGAARGGSNRGRPGGAMPGRAVHGRRDHRSGTTSGGQQASRHDRNHPRCPHGHHDGDRPGLVARSCHAIGAQNAFEADFHCWRRRAMSWARSSSLPLSSTWRSEGSARRYTPAVRAFSPGSRSDRVVQYRVARSAVSIPDQLCRRALMCPRQHPGELSRLDQDRVYGEHEGGQLGRDVGPRRRTRIVIAVQEPLVTHGLALRDELAPAIAPRLLYVPRECDTGM